MFGRLDVNNLQRDYKAKPFTNDLADRFDDQLDPLLDTLRTAQESSVRLQTAHKVVTLFRALHTGPLVSGFHPITFKGRFARFLHLVEDLIRNDELSWSATDVMVVPPEQQAQVDALKTVIFTEPKKLYNPKGGKFGNLDPEALERSYGGGVFNAE